MSQQFFDLVKKINESGTVQSSRLTSGDDTTRMNVTRRSSRPITRDPAPSFSCHMVMDEKEYMVLVVPTDLETPEPE